MEAIPESMRGLVELHSKPDIIECSVCGKARECNTFSVCTVCPSKGFCGRCMDESRVGAHKDHIFKLDSRFEGFEYCGQDGCCFPHAEARAGDSLAPYLHPKYQRLQLETKEIRLISFVVPESDGSPITCILRTAKFPWPKYTALSYCWGDPKATKTIGLWQPDEPRSEEDHHQPAMNCGPFKVTESLYHALRFLRGSKSLRRREWFWIDAICINQNDEEERNNQVKMMEDIYAQAEEVCVFLEDVESSSPFTASVGLHVLNCLTQTAETLFADEFDKTNPHVNQIRELVRPDMIYTIADGRAAAKPDEMRMILYRGIFQNPWFRRIWVLQEVLRARGSVRVCSAQRKEGDPVVSWPDVLLAHHFIEMVDMQKPAESKIPPPDPVGPAQCSIESNTAKNSPSFLELNEGVELTQSLRAPFPELWRYLSGAKMVDESGDVRLQLPRDSSHARTTPTKILNHPRGEGSNTWDRTRGRTAFARTPLLDLLKDSLHCFHATDPRDKLYALFGLAAETANKTEMATALVPDYSKPVAEVFCNLTKWCITHYNSLDVLSLVRSKYWKSLKDYSGIPGSSYEYPSWGIWPQANPFSNPFVGRVLWNPQNGYDLGAKMPLDETLVTNPGPPQILPLRGLETARVRSVFPYMFTSHVIHRGRYGRRLEMLLHLQEMAGGPNSCPVSALAFLWDAVRNGLRIGLVGPDDAVQYLDLGFDLRLNGDGSRYAEDPEKLLNDLLETLLMKNDAENSQGFLWDGLSFACKLSRHWKAYDPEMTELPPSLREVLHPLANSDDVDGIYEDSLDFLMSEVHGFCFFVTEDDRMGLCPPGTEKGDSVAALFGGSVPYILRQKPDTDSLHPGCWELVGECYVHGKMHSQYLEELLRRGHEPSIFHLI